MKQIKFSLIIVLAFFSLFLINRVKGAIESGSVTVSIPVNFTSGTVSVTVNGTNANGAQVSKTVVYNLSSNVTPVNGVCGSDNNQSFYSLLNNSSGACSAGQEANFTTTGGTNPGWTWNCNGTNGGSNVSCSANKKVDGVCTNTLNTCAAGSFLDTTDGQCTYNWTCLGINGGSAAVCSLNKPIGTSCNDSNACTSPDTCTLGVCSGPNICNAADLVVQNPTVSGTLTAGNTLSFSATVRNSGGSSAGATSRTRLRIDKDSNGGWDIFSNQVTSNLAVNATETETWTNAWTNVPAGNHKMEVCADVTNTVTESNETNNCVTANFSVSAATCTTLTYQPATSGFSTSQSDTAPFFSSLSVAPGSVFYAFVDYGAITDAIRPPNVSGAYTCSYEAFVGTIARFHCTAPAASGSYVYVTGTAAGTPSNICASGPTNIGTVTVSAPAIPAITLSPTTMTFSGTAGGSAPPAQTLTITNTGASGSQLNWRAQTNQNWCRVNGVNNSGSITGGPLNKDASSTVNVTVDAPSNTGTFTCTITVSDVAGVAASKTATVTYTVRPGDPGGGSSANVTASNSICEKISLSWTAGAGASSYNVYRNTVNSAPVTPYASGVAGTSYTDNTPTPIGTKFYYWVESVGGGLTSFNKVAANTNAAGGIAANPCNPPPNNNPGSGPVYNSSNDPFSVSAGGADCDQVRITWTDQSTNETGFKIFRGTTSDAGAAVLVQTVAANTSSLIYTPPDTNPYYYFVAATNVGGDSARVAATNNPVAAIACEADLVGSDKDIVAVNTLSLTTNSCGSTDPLPATVSLKRGDKLRFAINVCNQNGEAPATGIMVTDRLINLKEPATGWNASFNGNPVTPAVSGTVPNQTLVFDLSAFSVPQGAIYSLVFEAEIDVPAGYTGSTSRLQNSVKIDYHQDPASSATTSVNFSTPLLLFNVSTGNPGIIEVAP